MPTISIDDQIGTVDMPPPPSSLFSVIKRSKRMMEALSAATWCPGDRLTDPGIHINTHSPSVPALHSL